MRELITGNQVSDNFFEGGREFGEKDGLCEALGRILILDRKRN